MYARLSRNGLTFQKPKKAVRSNLIMEMTMTRTIHPVGQGAFYTECFEDDVRNYNIVYDCGSDTSSSGRNSLIEKEIKQTFKKGEIINALFISHFHRDHINGIATLLKHCIVKYVFLPVIDNISKLLLISSDDNTGFTDFILSPSDYIKNISDRTSVIFVDEEEPDSNSDRFFDLSQEQPKEVDYIPSGTKIVIDRNQIEWEYIPFNFKNDKLIRDIENSYRNIGRAVPDASRIDDVELVIAKGIFDIVLKSGPKRNAHSMILYSGANNPCDWTLRALFNNFCGRFCCHRSRLFYDNATGCLYFGDFDLNIKEAISEISKKYNIDRVKDNICIMQVPHHGSIHNFNIDIFNSFPRINFLFISAGENNRHRHPSSTVVKDILRTGRFLRLVTENKSSMLQFIYEKI